MYYFGAGPAAMPEEVLREISQNVVRHNHKISVLEMGHRQEPFKQIVQESEDLVRELLGLGEDYEVCWMHGGGRALFGLIPMNFLDKEDKAGFIESGHWSDLAMEYARFYGETISLGSSADTNYNHIPNWGTIPSDLAYLYLTTNNTLYGTQFKDFPETTVPLVVDMTSELFSRDLDYKKFDFIFAAAQKNVGPAGVTLVVAKKDFLSKQKNQLPGIFSFKELFEAHSTLNTPPVFAIYASLVYLRWTKRMGLQTLWERNKEKARLLYEAIDESKLFKGTAEIASRSMMNVCFRGTSVELEEAFLDFSKTHEILGIKGHRSVGGFRVSLYNAISPEAVRQLIRVMRLFEKEYC